MAAPDDRPAGVAPAAQSFKLVGRHDVLIGDDAFMGFPMADALLLRIANPFAAGPLPLLQAAAGVAMGLNRGQRRNRH